MSESVEVDFDSSVTAFFTHAGTSHYTAICGGNNSGKSLALKQLKVTSGRRAYMVGPQRFYHVHELATQNFSKNDYDSWESQSQSNFRRKDVNTEQNFIDLNRIVGGLKDKQRNKLFKLCGDLIGAKFTLARTDPENELSPRYIDMDGLSIAVGSTGTRLLMTLLGICMDEEFDSVIIDEPELGLSPRIQTVLVDFLSDKPRRENVFPHLKRVIVATHSHIFLDKKSIRNNFIVKRDGALISIEQVDSISKLHELQFNLLGNSLESLFLPSAFVIVEGKTDKPYLEKLIAMRHPTRKILVIESQGDVKREFKNLCNSLGDITKSPFRSRIFVVLDSVNTVGTKDKLTRMGAIPDNVVVWNSNGIEYVYPVSLMCSIFTCSPNEIERIDISGDDVSFNGVDRRKTSLSAEIVSLLDAQTVVPEELEEKLLAPLALAIGD